MSINLKAPSAMMSSVLIADTVNQNNINGSPDCTGQPTLAGGSPVSAALEIQSKRGGVLIPRMTTAEINLLNVTDAMMVYDTTLAQFKFRQGGAFVEYSTGGGGGGYSPGNPTYLQDTFVAGTKNISMSTPAAMFGVGLRSVAIGDEVLQSNVNGDNLIAIGYLALANNSTGDDNTAVGQRAMLLNTSGNSCTAIGSAALINSNADDCTAVGYQSLSSNTSGTNLTAVGVLTLASNITGQENSAFGDRALISNDDGSYNYAFGNSALGQNISGSENCAFGYGALFENLGSFNCSFGNQSMNEGAGANNVCAFGFQSLVKNIANESCAFGSNSAEFNTTGSSITAVGFSALRANVDGSDNTAIGSNVLASNISGSGNTSVGSDSSSVSTGSDNTAVGHESLNINADGNSNTAAGSQSGAFLVHGSNNTFAGQGSGGNIAATLDDCTFVGSGSSADVDGLVNATAIGANTIVSQSNSLILGDSTVPTKVGIGTNSPENALHVVGEVQIRTSNAISGSGIYLRQYSGLGGVSGAILFPMDTTRFAQILVVRVNISVMEGTGNAAYGTSFASVLWNGSTVVTIGSLPGISLTNAGIIGLTAAWSIFGNNLRLVINAANPPKYMISAEFFYDDY